MKVADLVKYKTGDLVKIRRTTGIGMVVNTLSTEGPYFDVYLPASQKIVFCHANELELISESR